MPKCCAGAASLAEGQPIRLEPRPPAAGLSCTSITAIHVNKGVGCVTCHGPVDRMPLTWQGASLHMSGAWIAIATQTKPLPA